MKTLWRKVVRWLDVFADNRILNFQIGAVRDTNTRLASENARLRGQAASALIDAVKERQKAEMASLGEQAARTLLESERGISAERLAEIDRLQELNRRTIIRMEEDAATIEQLRASANGTKARPGTAIYPPRSETR